MGEAQPGLKQQQPQMLKISLGPARIPGQLIHQGRMGLLMTIGQFRFKPDLVPCSSHKGGLNKIMAGDAAAEYTRTTQPAKAAVAHEGFHPDNGVMPPIGSL